MTGDKSGEVSDGEAHTDTHQGDCLLIDDGSPHCEDACDVMNFPATYDVPSREVKRGCYDALGLNKESQVADIIDVSTCVRGMLDTLSNDYDSADDATLCLTTSYLEPKGPATQNAVCRSGLRSLSAAECYILSRLF